MRKKPDYHVVASNGATLEEGPVGAAWKNPDGSIEIRLCPFTQLIASPGLKLSLLPLSSQVAASEVSASVSPELPGDFVYDDIELPF